MYPVDSFRSSIPQRNTNWRFFFLLQTCVFPNRKHPATFILTKKKTTLKCFPPKLDFLDFFYFAVNVSVSKEVSSALKMNIGVVYDLKNVGNRVLRKNRMTQ